MEIAHPIWLNKEFVKYALQGGFDDQPDGNIIIESLDINRAVPKGDNLLSDVFRATVKYRKRNASNTTEIESQLSSISFIIKAPLIGGLADHLIEVGILKKEVDMYKTYLPKMNKILGDTKIITPNSYFTDKENVVVLEDLKFHGYVMADRRAQLDYDHAVLALEKLAIFHAVSVRLYIDEPELIKKVGKELFYNEALASINTVFTESNFVVLAHVCKSNPNLEQYVEKLLYYGKNAWDILVDLMKPSQDDINVLNHGDYWVNNMLFRYNENNEPFDLKIIDLQISRYARPSLDLLYFFYGSVQEEVRVKRIDELLDVYVNTLNENLLEFGVQQHLTKSKLNQLMHECGFFAVLVSVLLYPIAIADPNDGHMDLGGIEKNDLTNVESSPFIIYYKSERYQKVIATRFAEFKKIGWF